MLVAVQGCSHGSLAAIYDSIARYTSIHGRTVDLLLLCGDFQALRSVHDFPSLAVPPKYHTLGTFHQYYSGEKVAPVLTIVIGGNHEASNYMWELYHGGWLAPRIYYLGAAGSVYVDGLRIVGASGIYKDHDYGKGHFEKVPYNSSTLRSVYHIRSYDVAKLMQLPQRDHTVFLSHDWPITIPHHGDTPSLLRRKPFFRSEVERNTLGSPPLLGVLRHIQPDHWFAAHLHVKFAAVYKHPPNSAGGQVAGGSIGADEVKYGADRVEMTGKSAPAPVGNPDEIMIEDEDTDLHLSAAPAAAFSAPEGNPDEIRMEDDEDDFPFHSPVTAAPSRVVSASNPEEITIDDEEFDDPPVSTLGATHLAGMSDKPEINADAQGVDADEARDALRVDDSMDLVEGVRQKDGQAAAQFVLGPRDGVADEAPLAGPSSGGRVTKFLALDKCGPGKDFIQFLDIPTSHPSTSSPPRLTYDPEWLAITRALHPYLSTQYHQTPLPRSDQLDTVIAYELARIRSEGLLLPSVGWDGEGPPEMVWEKGKVEVGRVQRFWLTAPAQGQPGGDPTAWYTNPQTEAFCGMLGISNKVNPAPVAVGPVEGTDAPLRPDT